MKLEVLENAITRWEKSDVNLVHEWSDHLSIWGNNVSHFFCNITTFTAFYLRAEFHRNYKISSTSNFNSHKIATLKIAIKWFDTLF